jgi:hypothetical protein
LFGYITAYKPELKIREWELYQAVYCGLCRSWGETTALFRMFLSYDFVFLALLIESANGKTRPFPRALHAEPGGKSNRSAKALPPFPTAPL